jgi:acyl-CoA synthetase (AMP-forming)/AMP-acid ligase II
MTDHEPRTDRPIDHGGQLVSTVAPDRLGTLITAAAAANPNRELFSFTGQRVSYGIFNTWVEQVCAEFATRGVHPGERIMVQLPNCLEALVLQTAAFRYGAIAVPVIPIYRQHEIRQIIADARPAVVAAPAELGTRAMAAEIDGVCDTVGHTPRLRLVTGGERDNWQAVPPLPSQPTPLEAELPAPADPEEPALILYTSGTTSAPKGVVLTSRAVLAHLQNMARCLEMDQDTVVLAGTPLAHLGGFVAGLALPAYLGARSVILPSWDPDLAVRLIDEERVGVMMGATVFIQDLIDRYRSGAGATHRLTTYMAAGAAVPANLITDAESVGVFAMRCYGMTETAGICTAARPDDPLERRANWDGHLLEGMQIQAVDEDGEPLPPGELGQLRIRGPQLLTHYTDPQVTAEQIDTNGWFYPGDIGTVDAEGWVQMTGRSKDIINRGGEKFSTQDIEAAIAAHPDVARAAVTAVPDPRLGEAVGAWITLRNGAEWRGPQPILGHLETMRLAKQKLPTEWHVVDQLPVTASGKVQKHQLSEIPDLATTTGAHQ